MKLDYHPIHLIQPIYFERVNFIVFLMASWAVNAGKVELEDKGDKMSQLEQALETLTGRINMYFGDLSLTKSMLQIDAEEYEVHLKLKVFDSMNSRNCSGKALS